MSTTNKRTLEHHLGVAEVADRLGMSARFVREHIKAGDFSAFLLGNKLVVSAASVNSYLERCRVGKESQEG